MNPREPSHIFSDPNCKCDLPGVTVRQDTLPARIIASELNHVIPPEIKDDEFSFLIRKLAAEENIQTVLEIGSSAGNGSTEAFVHGLARNHHHPRLFCMEISKPRFAALRERHAGKDFVRCYNVSSVPVSTFPSEREVADFYTSTKTRLNDYPLERVIGWLRQDIDYVQSAGVPVDGIERIKRENGIALFDMVLIDGSEFSGKPELDAVYGAQFILLDDINGFKNYHNRQRLFADPNYSLLYEKWNVRNGFSVFRRNDAVMPVHFFTIVLNGEPFIRHHLGQFRELPFRWHWHIIEGVADLKHDTAWSLARGGRIDNTLHRGGRSNDGTSEYLDQLAEEFSADITVYRKPPGVFWDGKLEMVNAPLCNISEPCLLWQIDADELWKAEQIVTARSLFVRHPEKTAAFYLCHFLVGPDLVITSRDTYGNHTAYEWLRTWRFNPGDRWIAHEPPRLCRIDASGAHVDVAGMDAMRHDETEKNGLVFQHYAYAIEAQLRFKESYYGYPDAVTHWRRLQKVKHFPVLLKDHFPWVTDEATVNTIDALGIIPLVGLHSGKTPLTVEWSKDPARILLLRSDSIGDAVLASSILEHIRRQYPQAEITVVCQQHIAELYESCPYIDSVIPVDKARFERDRLYRDDIFRRMQAVHADLALNAVHSRDPLSTILSAECGAREIIGIDGDASNISREQKHLGDARYTKLVGTDRGLMTELARYRQFLKGIGIDVPHLVPAVWTTPGDVDFGNAFMESNNLRIESTIALFPGAQWDVKLYGQYGRALAEICRRHEFTVVGLGSSHDAAITRQQLDALGVPTRNMCGKVTLRQAAELLRRCRLAVGADSALAHMACAVGTPNVVVLGGGHFGRFFPYSPLTSVACLPLECYGCNWKCRYDRPYCIQGIVPEVLSHAVRESLYGNPGKPRIHVQAGMSWEETRERPRYEESALNAITIPADVYLHQRQGERSPKTAVPEGLPGLPRISVITPSFNQAQYIEQTILSVLHQHYPDVEHIIIDGGSTDGTIDILGKYSHLKWFSKKDNGQSEALNKGFRMASGDIIAWINADDWYEPGAFEAIAGYFRSFPDRNVVMGDCNLVNEQGNTFDKVTNDERGFDELRRHWVPRSIPTQPAVFFRRQLFEDYGYLDESLHFAMDYDLWMRFAPKNRFYHLNRTVANYRFHSAAKGGDQDWSKFLPDCNKVYNRYCTPVVSVIIPCYNYASYLPSAVQSVLEQTFQAFEIIIVNDGSTDNTTEVARRLIAENPRIAMSLVNQENSGHPALARNAGIRCATGEYILCLDADDVIAPSALSRMREALDRNPTAGVAYCYIQHFGNRNDVWKNGEFTLSALRKDNVIPYCSLFRKQIWSQLGGMKSDAGFEDWEFWLSMCEENWTGVLIPEPLFGYRQHAEGRYSEDSQKRSYLIAKMIVHHPRTFSPKEIAEARAVIRQWENSPFDALVQEARHVMNATAVLRTHS